MTDEEHGLRCAIRAARLKARAESAAGALRKEMLTHMAKAAICEGIAWHWTALDRAKSRDLMEAKMWHLQQARAIPTLGTCASIDAPNDLIDST